MADRRAMPEAVVIVAATVAVFLIPRPWTALPAAAAMAGFVWARRGQHFLPAATALAVAGVGLALAAPIGWIWPVPGAIGLAMYLAVAGRSPVMGTGAWVRRGRPERIAVVLAVVSVPVTSVALWAFIASGRTDLEDATEGLRSLSPVWLVLAGVGFALVNPTVEEALFRGLLQPALVSEGVPVAWAIALQAGAFGAIHLHGIPGGPLGMAMAGTWGAVLGVVRHRSNGLLLVWLVHVAANATIYATVVVMARHRGLL